MRTGPAEAYEPGAFYRRELPLLLAVLARLPAPPDVLVIDGFVWLDGAGRKGLGAHLHEETGIPVIGVAKTGFHEAERFSLPVRRGASDRPLFVTAAGLDPAEAAAWIARMHGAHRLPTLLSRADALARATLAAS